MTPPPADRTASPYHRDGIRMPDRIAPMLASPGDQPFDSPDHIFELMWGGLRAMAHIRDGHLRLIARNGIDLAPHFPELRHLPGMVEAHEAILDGEIVVLGGEGQPDFDALRPRLHALLDRDRPPDDLLKPRRVAGQITYQAFDILWLDGRPLQERLLWQRKNALHTVIRASTELSAVDFVDDEGIAFFEAVVQRRLEGVVAKEKSSAYTPGARTPSWREVRALQSGDFVVGGYTFGGTRRRGEPFSQLLLGGYEDGRFEYVGAVSGGLDDAEARALVAQLEPGVVDAPPFGDPPPVARLVYWVEPSLVCHVRFSEWSRDGFLRFPIFSALRPDLRPEDCALD